MSEMAISKKEGRALKKAEKKRIKELNKSIVTLPKTVQQSMGIMAVQKEHGVYFLGNYRYMKMYLLKNPELKEKDMFIEKLCDITKNRIRISYFCQDNIKYAFISVYFYGESYSAAYDEISVFEEELKEKVCRPLRLNLSQCSIDSVLMYIHMNCTGEMKEFDHTAMLNQKENWRDALLPEINVTSPGMFTCEGKYGMCFSCNFWNDKKVNVNEKLTKLPGKINLVVDIQNTTDSEKEIFDYELEKKYNYELKEKRNDIINLTYLIAVLEESKAKLMEVKKELSELFRDSSMLLVPGGSQEEQIFYSIGTLGIIEFRLMRNVSKCFVSSLLL